MRNFIVLLMILLLIIVSGCQPKKQATVDTELKELIKSAETAKQQIPEAVKSAFKENRPLVLFFYGKWDQISEQVSKSIDTEAAAASNIRFIKVNIDDPQMAYLIAKFDVGSIPETVIIDGAGKTVMRKNGWIDKKTIAAGVAAASKSAILDIEDSL